MHNFQDKTVLISGGSDGIGRAMANAFAQRGAQVIIFGRTQEKLDATTNAINAQGGRCHSHRLDVGHSDAYARLIRDTAKTCGLDVLINNAPHVGYGMIIDTDLADFQTNFKINMDAAYAGTQAAISCMKKDGGSIINMVSINATHALAGMAGYSAAKAALLQFTRVAAMEVARDNIRINAIAPGPIMTPATKTYFNADPQAAKAISNANPMGRIGHPQEVASVALFLASDEASYITGTCIPVDGGKASQLYVPQ